MREGFQQTGNIQQLSTGYIQLAAGTTAQRPAVPVNGMMRYNTELGGFEVYAGNSWAPITFTFDMPRMPNLNDDRNSGYYQGAKWIFGARVYICVDDTAGAAVWTELSPYPTHPGLALNRYYGSSIGDGTLTTGNASNGVIYAVPVFLSTGMTFNRVGCEVTSIRLSGTLRLALYNNDTATGRPGTLVADLGTASTGSLGAREIAINVTVGGTQFFWLAFQTNGTTQMRATTSTAGSFLLGRNASNGVGVQAVTASQTYGTAAPAVFPTTAVGDTNNAPFLWIRKV